MPDTSEWFHSAAMGPPAGKFGGFGSGVPMIMIYCALSAECVPCQMLAMPIRKLTKYFFDFYGFFVSFVPFLTFLTFARRGTARPKSQKSQMHSRKVQKA